ncbi:MAG: PEP-CTERM sorting domain-containing protein [Thermoguttaceae bacterium]|jgi:hypothetical protein
MMRALVLIALVVCSAALPASAAPVSWVGSDGNWGQAANWSPGLPTSGDDVIINAPSTVTLDAGIGEARSLSSTGNLIVRTNVGSTPNSVKLHVYAGGGQITGPLTLEYGGLNAHQGVLKVNGPTTITGANLSADEGATLSLPTFTSYRPGNRGNSTVQWRAKGSGAQLDLSALTEIQDTGSTWSLSITAFDGGRTVIGNPTFLGSAAARGTVWWEAWYSGSTVDLRAIPDLTALGLKRGGLDATDGRLIVADTVTSLDGFNLILDWNGRIERADGTDAVRRLTSLANGEINVFDAAPDFSGLTNINGTAVYANLEAAITFPETLSTFVVGEMYHDRPRDLSFEAWNESTLDFSSLRTIQAAGAWQGTLCAAYGGRIDLRNVQAIPGNGYLDIKAWSPGALIDLSSLTQVDSDVSISVSDEATLILGNSVRFNGSYEIELLYGGRIVVAGTLDVSPGATLGGEGNLQANLLNAGTVSPGSSPGLLTITGDYTQTADGTLAIELMGTVPETDYDVLSVTGRATLDGRLDLTVVEDAGFELEPGMEFWILQSSTLSGAFEGLPNGVAAWDEAGGDGDQLFIYYSDRGVVLRTAQEAVPEPATWGLVLLGMVGLALARRMPRSA